MVGLTVKQFFFGDFPCVTNFVTFIQIYLYVSTNIYNLYVSTNVYNPYLPKHPRNCTNDNYHTGCFFSLIPFKVSAGMKTSLEKFKSLQQSETSGSGIKTSYGFYAADTLYVACIM